MKIIDKTSQDFIEAIDAEVTKNLDDLEEPRDKSIDAGVHVPQRRNRPEEIQFFLKQNTLAVLERLHDIATDKLWYRDNAGQRQRTMVPAGVQLQASIAFLDRAMGKPQVNIDLTSGDRPIVFDAQFNAPPLVIGHQDAIVEDATIEAIESIDTGGN